MKERGLQARASLTFGLLLTIVGTADAAGQRSSQRRPLYRSGLLVHIIHQLRQPAITVARSLSDSFAGIAPSCIPAFIAAQIVGAVSAILPAGSLFPAFKRNPNEPRPRFVRP